MASCAGMRRAFRLQPGITGSHIIVYLWAVMMTIAGFVFMSHFQGFLLSDILHLPQREIDPVMGILLLADEVLSLLLMPLWGLLSDTVGRRVLYASGFVAMGAAFALYPTAARAVPDASSFGALLATFWGSLLCYRLLFSVGASITGSLMAAFLSDSASPCSRGRYAGLIGLCSGLGAVLGVAFFPSLPKLFRLSRGADGEPSRLAFYQIAYYSICVVECATAMAVLIWMRNRSTSSDTPYHPPEEQSARRCPVMTVSSPSPTRSPQTTCPMLSPPSSRPATPTAPLSVHERLRIVGASFRDERILLAYVSGFVARTLTVVIPAYFPRWIARSLEEAHRCPPPVVDSALPCALEKALSGRLMGILQTVSLLMAPMYGFLSNRVSGTMSTGVACALGLTGLLVMAGAADPESPLQYLGVVATGAGQIGVVVTGLTLIANAAPPGMKGTLSGAYGWFGSVGILVHAYLVAWAMGAWSPLAPIYILAFWMAALLLFTLVVHIYAASRPVSLAGHQGLESETTESEKISSSGCPISQP